MSVKVIGLKDFLVFIVLRRVDTGAATITVTRVVNRYLQLHRSDELSEIGNKCFLLRFAQMA